MRSNVGVSDYTNPISADRTWLAARLASWLAVDWAVILYASYVAVVAAWWTVPRWRSIVAAHVVLIAGLGLLPPRGSAWEAFRPNDPRWLWSAKRTARFLRYTYPALLLTFFFEEVALTVNAASPHARFWFEHDLFSADRALFGGIPAVMWSQAGNRVLDEIMSAFHFSYFLLIIGGIVIAWTGTGSDLRPTSHVGPTFRSGVGRSATPARGFHTAMTCMMLGFFLSYVWYPFLPARGPWEHADLMAGLRPFGGWIFTPLLKLLMSGVAVSGGCFPSAHVSGTWALTFGLYRTNRKPSLVMGAIAVGLSIACIYTRYHYAVDVFAGLAVAVVAATIGYALTRKSQTAGI